MIKRLTIRVGMMVSAVLAFGWFLLAVPAVLLALGLVVFSCAMALLASLCHTNLQEEVPRCDFPEHTN